MPPGPTDGPSNLQRPPVLSDAPEKRRPRAHRCLQDPRMPPRNQMSPASWIHGCPQTHTIYLWAPWKSSGSTDVPSWTHECPPGPTDAPTKSRCPPGPTDVTRTCRCHQHTQKPLAPTGVPRTHTDIPLGYMGATNTPRCAWDPWISQGLGGAPETHRCPQDPEKPTRTCAHTPRRLPGPTDVTKPPRCPLTHGCPLKPLGPWLSSGRPSSP